jgi:hypothetical protein
VSGKVQASTRERLERRVQVAANGCHIFDGYALNSGYATLYDGRTKTKRLVHRIAYELYVGPIPDGMQIDHVAARGCTSKLCVNPAHLEAVTPLENTRRALGDVTHCVNGHEFTPANTRIVTRPDGQRRACRRCDADRAAAYRARKAVAA